jgi:predicted Zn-dependent protease
MLQSLTNPFQRNRAERPSGAYMQGPSSRPGATSPLMRKRKTPPPAAMSPKQQRDDLRDALQIAMNERRYGDALNHILGLVALEPNDPRWPHKYGDVLRSLRRNNEAAAAYRRAARRYEAAGFPVRATAMMRLAGELEGDSGPCRIEPEDRGRRMISGTVDVTVPVSADDMEADLTEAG